MNVLEVNPGFRVDKIVAMDVALPSSRDPNAKVEQATFFTNLIERLRHIPGVRAVGAASALPLDGGLPDGMFALVTPNGDLRLLTIVGIVGDTHEYGLDVPPRPTVYVNLFQRPRATISVTMLSDTDTQSLTAAARGALQDLDPEIPARFRTLSQVYAASVGSRRFNVVLLGFFGITALVLATTGVFGVMAYSVSRRTREIGVRVALGASAGDVRRMILSQGMRTIVIGVATGIAGALALTRTVQSLLFGVTATDPLTFGGVTLLLVGAALLACYVPARRATKVDPIIALRYE